MTEIEIDLEDGQIVTSVNPDAKTEKMTITSKSRLRVLTGPELMLERRLNENNRRIAHDAINNKPGTHRSRWTRAHFD